MKSPNYYLAVRLILLAVTLLLPLTGYADFSSQGKSLYGVCYGPFRKNQRPGGTYPTKQQIVNDILILRGVTSAIRTYGIDGVLFEIPEICSEYGLDCYVGCWISGDYINDLNTISDLIEIANRGYGTTKALIVGNEYIYRNIGDPCCVPYLTGLINQVRQSTDTPVTTAEPWDIWFVHPELVDAVDFIAIHHYAFWRGFDISIAAQQDVNVYNAVKNEYPKKEIMILETGWPSKGGTVAQAVPSEANQKKFLEDFLLLAKQNDIKYFIFEAFDEPWKKELFKVGDHWGLYYSNRKLKPQLENIIYFPGFFGVQQCTVTAGSKTNSDKISISGQMCAAADSFNDPNNVIVVTVDSNDIVTPCAATFHINNKTFKNDKYSYSGTENKVRKSFTYDLKTRKFSFAASKLDLSGLGCPLAIKLEIGDFNATDEFGEAIVNGPEPIPIQLMTGVKNVLSVDKYTVKKGKKANPDQLTVSGGFTVETPDPNMNNWITDDLVITLDDGVTTQTFTVPAPNLTPGKGNFSCTKANAAPSGVVAATFDFNKCSFTLTIKNTEITATGDVTFGVSFAGFDESDSVSLP